MEIEQFGHFFELVTNHKQFAAISSSSSVPFTKKKQRAFRTISRWCPSITFFWLDFCYFVKPIFPVFTRRRFVTLLQTIPTRRMASVTEARSKKVFLPEVVSIATIDRLGELAHVRRLQTIEDRRLHCQSASTVRTPFEIGIGIDEGFDIEL